MPAYINHVLLTKEVLEKENFNASIEYATTFSLAGDLTKFSKVRYQSHHEKQEEFIENMAEFIIKNNETNNEYLLGTLYGHICHYVMDNTVHPLVRKISKECPKQKISNHTLLELYYDEILLKRKLGLHLEKFKARNYLSANMKKVSKMIDYSYQKTYGIKHINFYYKFNLFLYKNINILYIIPGKRILNKILKYEKFVKNNKEKLNEKDYFLLYEESIKKSILYIKKINKILGK